ncbi:MAG: L-histidine N(alpha)-methyltransferase [Chromatiales bacterium]|nr:L-histidine N(alpha)-methyltransferase [Chromatiales bacterium]
MDKLANKNGSRFNCDRLEPIKVTSTLEEDVIEGLSKDVFSLPPKYFYDDEGSELFEQICNSKDYYLTREESKLLQEQADYLIGQTQPDHIVEFGCGKSAKIRFLLNACERQGIRCTFWPIDICYEAIKDLSDELLSAYPWLHINAYVGDYHAGFSNMVLPEGCCLALFMGSTIGNFNTAQATDFLLEINNLLGEEGVLLLGVDRLKDADILTAAYDDSDGATARFNLNLLKRLNQELDADFVCDNFKHQATFNELDSQVEMRLVSEKDQEIYFAKLGRSMKLRKGESMLTEISRKFDDKKLTKLLHKGGFKIEHHISAKNDIFSLLLARAL